LLSIYNNQHLETLRRLKDQLQALPEAQRNELREMTAPYLAYRAGTGRFFREHLADGCHRICFEKKRSACCGREGIIVFFADFVVELLGASENRIEAMDEVLVSDKGGTDCVYLGEKGCRWKIKPVACEIFLCDQVRKDVLGADDELDHRWEKIRRREKSFTKPDRPVLFDDLERFFIERGYEGPLMFFHRSPGLLRLKKKHNVGRLISLATVDRS
jgi:hypothetical protein